ncbi:replication protein A 70 kDa DNA-binding subunit B-like [Chenopodium quinoa]|uniref:replication protein A 70 kDa DNA-binding subunit B-like n=1 Tax=Chenopodium quinoa TaxID=63459 RepID=UPI000B777A9F|nr:replication protein A 70 kDa DNA-binding subunit B-like [Chenopodium quinoa]
MKPEYTPLNKLSPVSKAYKVRVTVKEKSPIQTPPNKKKFQKLVFEDEEGNNMKATLFGAECDHFQKVFEHKKKYEIANAPVRKINPKFSSFPGECELTFGGMTKIQPIDRTEGPVLPEYISIADVPKTSEPSDWFDLLGIVVHMEDPRQVEYKSGRVADVRDISIVDESTGSRPMIISAWGQLALSDCEKLKDWATTFLVVSLTSVKPATHKGFSLQSSVSTTIDPAPSGEKADALRAWAHAHPDIISDYMSRQLEFMIIGAEPVPTTLDNINGKTVDNTVQEEIYTLTVTIPDAQLDNVIAYIGCDNCGKRCGVAANVAFFCPHCPDKKCTSTERVNFTFDAADDTGTCRLTAFGQVCEQIFKLKTLEIFERKIKDDWKDFDHVAAALKSTLMHIILYPSQALNRAGVLRWVVQSVSHSS